MKITKLCPAWSIPLNSAKITLCILVLFSLYHLNAYGQENRATGVGDNLSGINCIAINLPSTVNDLICFPTGENNCVYRFTLKEKGSTNDMANIILLPAIEQSTWNTNYCITPKYAFKESKNGPTYWLLAEEMCQGRSKYIAIQEVINPNASSQRISVPQINENMSSNAYRYTDCLQFVLENHGEFNKIKVQVIQPKKGKIIELAVNRGLQHLSLTPRELGIKQKTRDVYLQIIDLKGSVYTLHYTKL